MTARSVVPTVEQTDTDVINLTCLLILNIQGLEEPCHLTEGAFEHLVLLGQFVVALLEQSKLGIGFDFNFLPLGYLIVQAVLEL